MGTASNVKIGVCNVSFDGVDLGYTKGGVTVSYSAETTEITVDQEDVPIDEIVMKQKFEVKVPMAEYDLTKLDKLLPGTTLVTDGTKKKLVFDGSAGTSLKDMAKQLVLTPVGGTNNDKITVFYAVPVPNLEFKFEKDNVRIFEITFKALKGVNGFVAFGDTTVTP